MCQAENGRQRFILKQSDNVVFPYSVIKANKGALLLWAIYGEYRCSTEHVFLTLLCNSKRSIPSHHSPILQSFSCNRLQTTDLFSGACRNFSAATIDGFCDGCLCQNPVATGQMITNSESQNVDSENTKSASHILHTYR